MKENNNQVVLMKAHYFNDDSNQKNFHNDPKTSNSNLNKTSTKRQTLANTASNSSNTICTVSKSVSCSFKAEIQEKLDKLNETKPDLLNNSQSYCSYNSNHNNLVEQQNVETDLNRTSAKTSKENMILVKDKGYENKSFLNDDNDLPQMELVNETNILLSAMADFHKASLAGSSSALVKLSTDDSSRESISSSLSHKSCANKKPNNIPHRVTLSWHSLSIKMQKMRLIDRFLSKFTLGKRKLKYETILDCVKGIVEPGEMLALMGASGSGKTTLLNALNYSTKHPLKVCGKIYINGYEADQTRMKIVSSYVQQDDLFFGTLTVKEHLTFHAMMRMDKSISREAKLKRVNEVLKEKHQVVNTFLKIIKFNLDKCTNVKIGIPGKIKGISGGEKRRLSFASEILTDPPLLFCDEPTSGLDAYMAKSVIYYLQKMAQSGKTIICTIHQPSSETFSIFDKICILSQTRVAYFGKREDCLTFFTKNLCKIYPPFTNPADFYMDVLGVDINDAANSRTEIQGYCDAYLKSKFNQEIVERIENVKRDYFSVPSNYTPYKSSWLDQMNYLVKRSFFNYFRNYKVALNELAMVIITGLLGGLIFFRTSNNEDSDCIFDQKGIGNVTFALFYTLTFCIITSTLNAVMVFPLEIPIFYREHNSSVYRSDTYYISKILIELPLYVLLPAIHSIIIYYMVGFGCDASNFFIFLVTNILVSNAAYSLGHIMSIVSSDVNLAVSLSAPTLAIQMLFSGFFLERATRTPKWLTNLKYVSIFNYGYDLLMINQLQNVQNITCEYDLEILCLTSGPAVLTSRNLNSDDQKLYYGLLLSLTVLFRFVAYVILWFKGRKDPLRLEVLVAKVKKRMFTRKI